MTTAAKFIHITKPSRNNSFADAKGTMCGRLVSYTARTSDAGKATCTRCLAEMLASEAPVLEGR